MTDLIRTALLGTDATGDDYAAFMRSVTVHSMQRQAGYVAPVMEGEGVLPSVEFLCTGKFPAWGGIGERIGTVHYIQILMKCCSHCRFHIGKFLLDDTVYVYTTTDVTHCEICGDKVKP